MPKYVISDTQDETQQALDPDGTNAKVSFNNSDASPAQEKSRISRVVIIVLGVVCCVAVLVLCAWFVYSVFIKTTPEWQTDDFMIETVPGHRYGPKETDGYTEGTLIAFSPSNANSYKRWTNVIEDIIEGHLNTSKYSRNAVNCDYDSLPKPGKVCIPEYRAWFPCTKENNFGFQEASPCVFIRFNKIANWTPEYYNSTSELPAEMPASLKERIAEYYGIYRALMKTVWLSCDGESPTDVENLGPIQYLPRQGFPGYYFPYNNTENYVSPIVPVRFVKPRTGVLINIECRLWAPNIEYNREKGRGFVHFELMID
ncbi:hypothetical protein B7P43_G12109 [Cryptotermes secundus]|uniref:Sodium/potassium-transporting ATPase subunit beta-2 n=1 Tax=Cryptotermes secundus TaxID=105785 RepID=A0A2J7RL48_9NEOP|nr:sodium/potassium-transporting ATPase subunit beta-2 [Cryptotermes secundus]PNF41567.1 hypothetical protein B7P43_G12109 [Cryptotermes secundus]